MKIVINISGEYQIDAGFTLCDKMNPVVLNGNRR